MSQCRNTYNQTDFQPTSNLHSKSSDKFDSKQYFKELERGYIPQDTPGPCAYDSINLTNLSKFRMSFNGSFTREKRDLNPPSKVDKKYQNGPSPQSYDTQVCFQRLKSHKGAGTMGKGSKELDIRMMQPQFKKYIKGIV